MNYYLLKSKSFLLTILNPTTDHFPMVSAVNFSLFRFFFGLLMIPQIINLVPDIHDLATSTYVFHYPYLWFIEAWSHELIDALQYISLTVAILLALGIVPRIAALIFMLSFGYLFLIDMSFYNNHYYLWCLFSFLFAVADTHLSISVIDVLKGRLDKKINITNYAVFGFLVSIVYFYATIAKINGDWLQGYPMRLMTAARNYPFPELTGYIMSYGGILFDGAMSFILWKKPKTWYVVLPYFAFHLTNYFVFNIGIFPIAMLAVWLLYLVLAQYPIAKIFLSIKKEYKLSSRYLLYSLFFTFQILFPTRCYLFIPGNPAWHRQGHYFAWRMMLHNHEPEFFQYYVEFPDNEDNNYHIQFDKLLTYRQLCNTFNDPYFIWQLAQKLKKDAVIKYHTNNVKIFCQSVVTLNQHPMQSIIVETIDLGQTPYHFFTPNNFISTLRQ